MQKRSQAEARRSLLLCLLVLGLVAAAVVLPYQFGSAAPQKGLFIRTSSEEPGLPNYDIRTTKSEEASNFIATARSSVGKDASFVSDSRNGFAEGESALKERLPMSKIEYNSESGNPEVIVANPNAPASLISSASGTKNAEKLRSFIRENNSLIGVNDDQAGQLKVTADYTNPDGILSYAHLEQFINDVPVFQAEIKAGFSKQGQMFRVINNLAPGLSYESLSNDFGDPVNAVKSAFKNVSRSMTEDDTARNEAASTGLKVVFGTGDWATTAEKMYFPTEPGVAVPAWRVLIWQPVNAFYVIVDARDGIMLWRKNLTNDQTQTSTFEVYQAATAYSGIAANPAPMSPGPIDPTAGTQGTIISRTNLVAIGNEGTNPGQNNLGWINDGINITDGNNVEAGLDLITPNGIDAGTQATGNPNRVFSSLWNPPPGNPGPGEAPTAVEARRGAVIQMFYVMNKYHDFLYSFGFNEAARNFQNDNFGRGGVAADRVSAEGQDSSGTNNANFSAGSDGTRGRMQMFTWTGPSPQRDGTGDAEVIIHEVTHGTSQRLHNNNAGLTANMSGGMGEGWGDFFAHTLLARSGEPLDSINATGGYVLLNGFGTVGTGNYYYGIRRFPKARISFTGGPLNRPHNPMTFADIDSTQINVSNGAYPAMSGPHISTTPDQVHAAGEIWSSALWEVRCLMVGRLGFQNGSTKVLQYVTDGMKLDPINPTFLQGRDSIAQAAVNSADSPSAVDVREGFRLRGMGFTASLQSGNGTPARVTEAFDVPNAIVGTPVTMSDSPGDNDGFPEAGEPVLLSVPVTNATGATVNNVQVSVNGGTAVNYGNIADGATVTQQIPLTINVACGEVFNASIVVSSAIGTQVPTVRSFQVGVPQGGLSENFDGVTAPALPAGWTTAQSGGTTPPALWTSRTTTPASPPNEVFTNDPATNGDSTLVSPTFNVTSPAARVKFKIDHLTEDTWDGAVLEIKVGAGSFQDILAAGGSFVTYPYTDTLGNFTTCVTNGTTNPLNGRQAWSGNSSGYKDVEANLPAAANGQAVQFRIRMGSDCSVSSTGVSIDDVQVVSGYSCNFNVVPVRSRADFDGDGKTDLSVYRASEGNWYLNQSQAGFGVVRWGLSTDAVTPGDFDGDGKTDFAIFRPNPDASQPDFYVLNSNGFTVSGISWGIAGDKPVIADYDADGKSDIAVWRESELNYYVWLSGGGIIVKPFGIAGDVPVAGDFVGDSKADLTLYRPSTNQWWIFNGVNDNVVTFGQAGDVLVPADYNGDNKDDVAVFRPATGQWFYQPSGGGAAVLTNWGTAGDIPVPGDYDGDGKDDFAIYRNGQWWINRSSSGPAVANFGLSDDKAIPRQYLP